jgi:UDP-N-acetylglucosamine/UDP-N-acetylgalactosamine 4-epimerase
MKNLYTKALTELNESPRRWLVTGAAGFIGSNIVEKLLNLNQTVYAIDNFSTGTQENIKFLKSIPRGEFYFSEGDINDTALCNSLTLKSDYVLHQAALGSVPRSIDNPEIFHQSNVNGFMSILKSATDAKVKKFVFASSSSVYGDSKKLPKVEDEVGQPLSPYAATKAINEMYALVFAKTYNLRTIGLRYFNVFGPRQNPAGPYAAVIPAWLEALRNNAPIYINGDGTFSRDFCYVENVIQANILAALSSEAANSKVYNIAYGQQTTLLQLYSNILTAANKLLSKEIIPHSLADITKAKQFLGYQPQVDVTAGLEKTVSFFLQRKFQELNHPL